MEKYERKIKINRVIKSLDTDNDGVDDTLTLVNNDDLYVSFLLKQTIKDIGVYTDYVEEDVFDLNSFWETSNNGSGDFGTNQISIGFNNPYDGGLETQVGDDNLSVYGCTDPNSVNYNPQATLNDGSCDDGTGLSPNVSDEGSVVTVNGNVFGGCFTLSSGPISLSQLDFYTIPYMTQKAIEWCKATHPSCNQNWIQGDTSSYPILNNCPPNGCGSSNICCPGPINTYKLLTQQDCIDTGFDCSANSCNCSGQSNSIFGGIKHTLTLTGPLTNECIVSWSFYCVPN
jgi:hypothetical protein